eukprot:CAMPEP_0195293796 /NCGR_PEP_ID=MMETSP0707-20130614/13359_1 /TAXON_ID=33640 /ORGANISM="Asterionellopsis glacialis, Strain CCMP134" /LENGTH=47 /DNA_ID= /DNA_START= /DNA_END= /DNA_ORIENTATION=
MKGSTAQSIAALVAVTGITLAILCFSSFELMKPSMEQSQQQQQQQQQ